MVKIYMITYNVDIFLELIYNSLKENFLDDFEFIVVDNSDDMSIKNNIKKCCNKLQIKHHTHNNTAKHDASRSHGDCLNYLFRNVIPRNEESHIMVLDHDIFLAKKFSLEKYMENVDICGVHQHRPCTVDRNDWINYLWGNFFFVKGNLLHNINIGAKVSSGGVYLDTGVVEYDIKNLKIKYIKQLDVSDVIISYKNENISFSTFGENKEFVHFGGLSNWNNNSQHFMDVKKEFFLEMYKNITNEDFIKKYGINI